MNKSTSKLLQCIAATLLLLAASASSAGNEILGEVQLVPSTNVEKSAAVWVDGQYLGFLKELKGKRKVLLLPGEHALKLTLAGYSDVNGTIVVEPGDKKQFRVRMSPDPRAYYANKAETGQVQIDIEPQRAAVFVDGNYAGPVDAYNGRAGLRLSEGTHRFRIALPGFQPFETEVTVRAGQHYKIETNLIADGEELVWTANDTDDETEEAE